MEGREVKDALYEQFARVAKALASPKRIELLDVLVQGERSVDSLAALTAMGVTNTSAHLQVLKRARLVESRRQGTAVLYRPADEAVARLVAALRDVARDHLAEVEQVMGGFLRDRATLDAVGTEELRRRMRRKDVIVLDVRPAEEFAAGHIRGAISVPLTKLRRAIPRIPKDREIVAYCRGPYCVLAPEAVALLRAKGFRARRLEDGFPEWKLAGLPVAAGAEERA